LGRSYGSGGAPTIPVAVATRVRWMGCIVGDDVGLVDLGELSESVVRTGLLDDMQAIRL